jgi:feruloyl esterase
LAVLAAGVLLAGLAVPGTPARAGGRVDCDADSLSAIVTEGMTITSAARRDGPGHCLVDGYVTVTDPGPWNISFRLALPDRFAKRHFFYAQGGSGGGSVPWTGQDGSPAAPLEFDFARLMSKGFAIVAMDKGTAPSGPLDFGWRNDPAQRLNWDNRALQVIAETTQQVTRDFYGIRALHRYVSGCSGGGMGSINNLRVHGGRSFDGVIVGSTVAMSSTASLTWARILRHIASNPDGWIPPDRLKAAEDAIIGAYDDVDGARDGIIHDDRRIRLDKDLLTRAGLTPAQIETFDFITSPWTYHGAARPVEVPGYGISRPTAWSQWFVGQTAPPWTTTQPGVPLGLLVADSSFRAQFGADVDLLTDLDLDDPALHRSLQQANADGARNGPFDFRRFRDGGGKLLTYYGVDDAAIPYRWSPTIREGATAYEKHITALDRWYRAYLVPGLLHCAGGQGPQNVPPQLLDALVSWVEQGKPPNRVIADRPDGRSFLLCPEPQAARFRGGDVNDASDWRCAEPGPRR